MFLSPWHSYARFGRFPPEAFFTPGPVRAESTGEGWVFTAELPGFAVEDVKVEAAADSLTLSVESKYEQPEAGWTRVRCERPSRGFREKWRFERPIAVDAIEASVKDGVLTVKVPRAPEASARVIPVTLH